MVLITICLFSMAGPQKQGMPGEEKQDTPSEEKQDTPDEEKQGVQDALFTFKRHYKYLHKRGVENRSHPTGASINDVSLFLMIFGPYIIHMLSIYVTNIRTIPPYPTFKWTSRFTAPYPASTTTTTKIKKILCSHFHCRFSQSSLLLTHI